MHISRQLPTRTIPQRPHCTGIGLDEWFHWFVVVLVGSCPCRESSWTYMYVVVLVGNSGQYWRCRGIVVWPLDSYMYVESPGSNPTVARYFCPSARYFIHIAALDPDLNGDLVGCERYCGWVGIVKGRLAGILPREWRQCTLSAELCLNPMTGVIIHCEGLWS